MDMQYEYKLFIKVILLEQKVTNLKPAVYENYYQGLHLWNMYFVSNLKDDLR